MTFRKITGRVLLCSFLFLSSCSRENQSEKFEPYAFTKEEVHFQNYLQEGFYEGVRGTKNYYALLRKKTSPITHPLIFVTGLEDIVENWWLPARRAMEVGFRDIYIYEIRGQGRSQRVPGNDIQAAHVVNFENYVKDFVSFLKVIEGQNGKPESAPFIVAHSTGSLVVTSALAQIKKERPEWYPEKLSFWAPLMKFGVSSALNNPVAKPLLRLVDSVARQFGYLILVKKFVPKDFEENHITKNRERYDWSEKIRRGNGWASSGVSLTWALEAIDESELHLRDSYKSIDIPCLIFTAGQDKVVRNDWKSSNPNIQVIELAEAFHALHVERKEIFDKVVDESFEFFLKTP